MNYVEELSGQLAQAGIHGRRRQRILIEIRDHLACDPNADLGPAPEVARQFADQLGTVRARRAGLGAFGALAVAGLAFVTAFVAHNPSAGSFPRLQPASRPVAALALGLVAIGAQVAFVCGVLGGLRAFRQRHRDALPRHEATVIARRAGLGLAAGMACMVGLALLAVEYHRVIHGWESLALGASAVGAAALLAAAPLLISAASIRPLQEGPAGSLFDDLGPAIPRVLRGRDWLVALLVSAGVGALVLLGGGLADDPYDGAARGALDGLACLAGFALLGRYLGLRSQRVE